MHHYYIYFRVADKDAVETELLIRSMQARLACRSGISGWLLKKRDEPAMWMEVYEQVSNAMLFERLLAQTVDEFDIEMFLDSPRHLECFIGEAPPVFSCRP